MARYDKRLSVAGSERDVERVAEAAALGDHTSSEYIRIAVRERLARDLAPPRRPSRPKHEREPQLTAAA
jgi:hypothetical protein